MCMQGTPINFPNFHPQPDHILELRLPLDRGDNYLTAEDRLGVADWNAAVDVRPVALEELVLSKAN